VRDIVKIEINAPRGKVAELFADPRRVLEWMEETDYEPISGDHGMPGSTYRLSQRKENMVFIATVVERDLPNRVKLNLDSPKVSVLMTAEFVALSPEKTQLVSDEVFTFKGPAGKAFGFIAGGIIKKVHRKQMDAFKRFAESS
jgi:hypothetical protein